MQIYAWFSSLSYPSQGNPLWIAILSALLTPTVAVLAAYIGYQQWRTAERKRKADMFQIRFNLYKRLEHQLFIASSDRDVVDRLEFIRTIDELPFVFGPWVTEFRTNCLLAFYTAQAMVPNAEAPQEGRKRLAKAYVDLLGTFYEDMHID